MGDNIGMTKKTAQNIIVMQRPIHNSELLLSPAYAQNAFVMMCEPHKINSIIFIIICIHFSISKLALKIDTYSPFSKSYRATE